MFSESQQHMHERQQESPGQQQTPIPESVHAAIKTWSFILLVRVEATRATAYMFPCERTQYQ
eukprot:477995-Pelagomonas_calceolata.AAC.5